MLLVNNDNYRMYYPLMYMTVDDLLPVMTKTATVKLT